MYLQEDSQSTCGNNLPVRYEDRMEMLNKAILKKSAMPQEQVEIPEEFTLSQPVRKQHNPKPDSKDLQGYIEYGRNMLQRLNSKEREFQHIPSPSTQREDD